MFVSIYIYIYIYIYIFILFFFIIQRATPCHYQPPTRGDNTVSVAQGGTATPGAIKQLLPPDRVLRESCIYIYIYVYTPDQLNAETIYIYIYIRLFLSIDLSIPVFAYPSLYLTQFIIIFISTQVFSHLFQSILILSIYLQIDRSIDMKKLTNIHNHHRYHHHHCPKQSQLK